MNKRGVANVLQETTYLVLAAILIILISSVAFSFMNSFFADEAYAASLANFNELYKVINKTVNTPADFAAKENFQFDISDNRFILVGFNKDCPKTVALDGFSSASEQCPQSTCHDGDDHNIPKPGLCDADKACICLFKDENLDDFDSNQQPTDCHPIEGVDYIFGPNEDPLFGKQGYNDGGKFFQTIPYYIQQDYEDLVIYGECGESWDYGTLYIERMIKNGRSHLFISRTDDLTNARFTTLQRDFGEKSSPQIIAEMRSLQQPLSPSNLDKYIELYKALKQKISSDEYEESFLSELIFSLYQYYASGSTDLTDDLHSLADTYKRTYPSGEHLQLALYYKAQSFLPFDDPALGDALAYTLKAAPPTPIADNAIPLYTEIINSQNSIYKLRAYYNRALLYAINDNFASAKSDILEYEKLLTTNIQPNPNIRTSHLQTSTELLAWFNEELGGEQDPSIYNDITSQKLIALYNQLPTSLGGYYTTQHGPGFLAEEFIISPKPYDSDIFRTIEFIIRNEATDKGRISKEAFILLAKMETLQLTIYKQLHYDASQTVDGQDAANKYLSYLLTTQSSLHDLDRTIKNNFPELASIADADLAFDISEPSESNEQLQAQLISLPWNSYDPNNLFLQDFKVLN